MSELNASSRLMEMVFEAVTEALTSLRANQTIVPFTMTLTKEGIILKRFPAETLADGIERGRLTLADEDEDTLAYVLVYDATVYIGDMEYDAIMLETGERAKAQGWRFVQRYRSIGEGLIQEIGDLAYLAAIDSYLS